MPHVLFFTMIALWVLVDMYVAFFKRAKQQKQILEKKSKYVIVGGIIVGMSFGPLFSLSFRDGFLESFNFIRWIGLLILAAGIIIRVIAIYQLGGQFSDHIIANQKEDVYKKGLYAFIRHPSYFGEMMIFIGVGLVYHHLLSSLVASVVPTLSFMYRIHHEEKVLIQVYQDVYKDYMKQTKKIIPFIY